MTDARSPHSRPPRRRGSSRRWPVAVVVVLLMVVAVIVIGLVSRREQHGPSRGAAAPTTTTAPESRPAAITRASIGGLPLRGVPLRNSGGLRLLVADTPAPFILDVDRGTRRSITGLPTMGRRGVSVLPLGEDALVLSYRHCDRCTGSSAYILRHGSTAATRLGSALEVVPTRDGQSVWMLRRAGAGRCTITEVWLDGRERRAPRGGSCRTSLEQELPAGLLTIFIGPQGKNAHSALLRPDGHVTRFRHADAQPVVGNLLLSGADRHTPLVLHDLATGESERLRWPSGPDYGLGEVTGQPNGRLATIDFAKYSPVDRYDLWLLDTTTRSWQHLPNMPAHVVPKTTHVEWTADGRVVVLAPDEVAVWRRGDARLQVRPVKGPKQPGIQFVVW